MFSPTSPIRKEIQKIHWAVVALGFSAILISSLVIWIFSKQVTQPLIKIKQMTEQIAKGNYQVQLPVKGKDEITDLTLAINSMSKELHRYDTSRNKFLSNISHELKTPLMYIKGYADLLNQERISDPQEINDVTKIISDEITRVNHLVKDLFDLARYRDGHIELKMREINVVPYLKEIVDMMRGQIEKKNIKIEYIHESNEILALFDPERLEQVLINLLDNARTYTKENGIIKVIVSSNEKRVIIHVQDNGIGIPVDEIDYIWERFYRVEKSRSRNYGGTGLGLAISKEIIELHGGTITVESQEGKGSAFIIHLPIHEKT